MGVQSKKIGVLLVLVAIVTIYLLCFHDFLREKRYFLTPETGHEFPTQIAPLHDEELKESGLAPELWESTREYYEDLNIRLAREYQIDLSRELWSTNRDKHVENFLRFLKEKSGGLFDVKPDQMQEEGYHRYSYTVLHVPHSTPTIRLRDFTIGPRKGTTTVDLKYRNGDNMFEMFAVPATPAEKHLSTAVQKVEQDVHACDVRWSRGTRLFLDHSPRIDTLKDVEELFPLSNFPGIKKKGDTQTKKQNLDAYYWQLSYRGTLKNGLDFKLTFTFMYKTIDDAFKNGAVPKKDGEFSFRLFGADNGHSRHFRPQDLDVVNKLFEQLLWSEWNVDPEMECLEADDNQAPGGEVWVLPIRDPAWA